MFIFFWRSKRDGREFYKPERNYEERDDVVELQGQYILGQNEKIQLQGEYILGQNEKIQLLGQQVLGQKQVISGQDEIIAKLNEKLDNYSHEMEMLKNEKMKEL